MHDVHFVRWELDRCIASVAIEPLLASWDAAERPSQVRLREYLDTVKAAFRSVSGTDMPLAIHIDVRLAQGTDLLRYYDLENYLTPVAQCLRLARLVRASATKAHARAGSASCVQLWEVRAAKVAGSDWHVVAPTGSTSTGLWKDSLRRALIDAGVRAVAPGALSMEMVLRCSSRQRNWVNLWKPAGDALGPLLGESNPRNPFNPADDRIVALALHLDADDTMGFNVQVAVSCAQAI